MSEESRDSSPPKRRKIRVAPTAECCGRRTVYDPNSVGLTCGGLWVRGGDVCGECGRSYLPRTKGRAVPCDAPTWSVSKGGRSVDIGTGRIRFGAIKVETGERLDVPQLMARIAHLPEMERAARGALAWLESFGDRLDEHAYQELACLLEDAVGRPRAP